MTRKGWRGAKQEATIEINSIPSAERATVLPSQPQAVKRPRGRPRKHPLPESKEVFLKPVADVVEEAEISSTGVVVHKSLRTKGWYNQLKIDWEEVERLALQGDIVPIDSANPDGPKRRIWLTFKQIAERFNCSLSLVSRKAAIGHWREKRLQLQAVDGVVVNVDKPRALDKQSASALVEGFIATFQTKLQKGHIKAESVGDLDKAVRLLDWLHERDHERKLKEGAGLITLEEMQRRHKAARDEAARIQANPELAGMLDEGTDERE